MFRDRRLPITHQAVNAAAIGMRILGANGMEKTGEVRRDRATDDVLPAAGNLGRPGRAVRTDRAAVGQGPRHDRPPRTVGWASGK